MIYPKPKEPGKPKQLYRGRLGSVADLGVWGLGFKVLVHVEVLLGCGWAREGHGENLEIDVVEHDGKVYISYKTLRARSKDQRDGLLYLCGIRFRLQVFETPQHKP